MPEGAPGDRDKLQPDDSGRLEAVAGAAAWFSAAVPGIEALLAIVAEQISRTTGGFCAVVLLSPDGQRIEPVAAYHPDPTVVEDANVLIGSSIQIDASGPWKTALQERRTIVIEIDPDNLPANIAPHQARHIKRWRMREAVMIPMIAPGRPVRLLNPNRLEGSPPLRADDVKLLESLATRAARAIATAQVMRDQRLTADQLQAQVAERTSELMEANQFLD